MYQNAENLAKHTTFDNICTRFRKDVIVSELLRVSPFKAVCQEICQDGAYRGVRVLPLDLFVSRLEESCFSVDLDYYLFYFISRAHLNGAIFFNLIFCLYFKFDLHLIIRRVND